MGSVNTQSQACSRGERLSALVDGEMFEAGQRAVSGWLQPRGSRVGHYHLIGDALRSDELALSPALSVAFTARMSAALESEPHLLAPAAAPVARKLLSLRRRVVPAFAVAAAAATLTWIVVPQMQTAGAPGAVQVASAGAPQGGNLQRVTVAQASAQPGLQDVNIIRDASLDQYLEAHQQFAQQPVVTGSMPLIRAAVTTTPGQ